MQAAQQAPRQDEDCTLSVAGQTVLLTIPAPAGRPSSFTFSLHKAGSVLLDSVVADLCDAANVPVINLARAAFGQGVGETNISRSQAAPILTRDGYIFSGFRALFEFVPPEAIRNRKKVLLIRDPRDMLVSLYFSIAYSHWIPTEGPARDKLVDARSHARETDINRYVLENSNWIGRNYRKYMKELNSSWRVYRYEDIIFDKQRWIEDLCQYLDLDLPANEIERIAEKNDIRPSEERTGNHVRQVTPGNHRKHLSPETIAVLNKQMKDILKRFGYERRPLASRLQKKLRRLTWTF